MKSLVISFRVDQSMYDRLTTRAINNLKSVNQYCYDLVFYDIYRIKAPPPETPHELVQVQNPRTKHWVLIDKTLGKILKYSRTTKPYKDIPIPNMPSDLSHSDSQKG